MSEKEIERQEQTSEKREARRKRRIRNQILAYGVVVVLIIAVAAGVVALVRHLAGAREADRVEAEQEQQQMQEQLNELLAQEETIEPPPAEPEETPEPVVEMTPEEKLDEIVNASIEVMPIEDKVAGLFLVTPEAITGVGTAVRAGDSTKDALSRYAVGGIVYSGKNVQSKEQFAEMVDNTLLYTKYPLFVAVMEEGGKRSPMASAGLGTAADSPSGIAATGDTGNAYSAGSAIGAYLSPMGINLNLASVADIANVDGSVMKGRTFGSDAAVAGAYLTAQMQGLHEQNISVCLTHFPGAGSVRTSTADGMAVSDRTLEQLREEEFAVFRAGIDSGADMVMVSTMSLPAVTGDNTPCAMSEAVVTDLLRGELGYDGVIISEPLNGKAVTEYYDSAEAAVLSLRAGCDMILMPENFEEAYQGVLEAVQNGTISEERVNDSLRRIYRVKQADKITR